MNSLPHRGSSCDVTSWLVDGALALSWVTHRVFFPENGREEDIAAL